MQITVNIEKKKKTRTWVGEAGPVEAAARADPMTRDSQKAHPAGR